MTFRTIDHSDQWPFGPMTIRTNDPSDHWPFGLMSPRTIGHLDQWPFGLLAIRTKDHSEYRPVTPWWRDAPLVREFQMWDADVNNGIPIDFRAGKCVSVESDQPCCDNISWYIFSSTNFHYSYFTRPLLHAVYNTWLTPVTACGSQ